MTEWKKAGKKLLFPPPWLVILLTVVSAVLLAAVFARGRDTDTAACAVYLLSFYTLCTVCALCASVFPGYYRSIKTRIHATRYGGRYVTDAAFRTHVSLYASLSINLLYVAVNLSAGIWYRSVWSVTLGFYYVILAVMRFLLLRFAGRVGIGSDREKELRRSRLCGIILMTVNLVLSGVVAMIISRNDGFEYPGMLIYVMATYTFYITGYSAVNLFRYRRYNSPVMSAAKSISLTAALVSMLSLETAMLSRFGAGNTTRHYDQVMVGATGAAVCAIVVAMSAWIIISTNRELQKIYADKASDTD
ncbi:MAG: hypothetical protein ACI4LA_02185 [Emergencia sp.]